MAKICEKDGCSEKAVAGKNLCPAHLSKKRSLIGTLLKVASSVIVVALGVAAKKKI